LTQSNTQYNIGAFNLQQLGVQSIDVFSLQGLRFIACNQAVPANYSPVGWVINSEARNETQTGSGRYLWAVAIASLRFFDAIGGFF
jgi:hypothetical protein